jgi:hypothetical protein
MNNLLTITVVEDSTSRTSILLDSINADIESFDRSQLFEEREIATTALLQISDESEILHQHIRGNLLRKDAAFSPEDCAFIKEFHNFLYDKILPF